MSAGDLSPDTIKKQHADVISRGDAVKPQGVSEQAVLDYLKTDEGAIYYRRVAEAAEPGMRPNQIQDRAIGQLQSGLDLPRMEIIHPGDPLIKIIPVGAKVSSFSPYFTKLSELERAQASGKSLSDYFGLPVSDRYSVYEITPKVPTEVFINHVKRLCRVSCGTALAAA